MQPQSVYYLALALIGAPAAMHSRMAGICVAVGMLSCAAFAAGLPMAGAYLALHIAALGVGMASCPHRRCIVVMALFVDLAMIDVFECAALFSQHAAWWARYWVVLAQLAIFLPDARQGVLRTLFRPGSRPVSHGLEFRRA